jgi:hypothetical protein
VAATGGVATFTGLVLNTAANGYVITATAPGVIAGVSNSFNVTASSLSRLSTLREVASVVVSPPDSSRDVAPDSTVVVTFSQSFDPNTVDERSVMLQAAQAVVPVVIRRSADNRTIILQPASLPAGSLVTVAASGIHSLAGETLDDFSTSFTTAVSSERVRPQVVGQRPANGATGADPRTSITLSLDQAIDEQTLATAIRVLADGAPLAGLSSLSSDGRVVTFAPESPVAPGTLVEVSLDNTDQGVAAESFYNYTGHFRVVDLAETAQPRLIGISPAQGSIGPGNPTLSLEFSEPLDPLTVSDMTFIVSDALGNLVSGTLTLENDNRVIHFVPFGPLDTMGDLSVLVTQNVSDAQGTRFSGARASFRVGSEIDDVRPTASVAMIPGTSQGAEIVRVTFSEPIDPSTVNATTIATTSSGRVPVSFSFNGSNTEVTITPLVRLPSPAIVSVTVEGVRDPAGNASVPAETDYWTPRPFANGPTP